jgi:hypothetical protein
MKKSNLMLKWMLSWSHSFPALCYSCQLKQHILKQIWRSNARIINMNNFSSNIFPSTPYSFRKCVQMMSSAQFWVWMSKQGSWMRWRD